MRSRYVFLSLLLLAGCSAGSDAIAPVEDTILTVDVVEQDLSGEPDLVTLPDQATKDTGPDLVFDSVPDFSVPGCEAGEGCFEDQCVGNSDCQSGWCVNHMGQQVCTMQCEEECPDGWSCQQALGGPDLVYVCVSNYTHLCRPCSDGSDCTSPTGVEDVCVDYGDEGSFCGGACGEEGQECPWGFTCKQVETTDGVTLQQCLADAGACPCTDSSVELGLFTPCESANESGTCAGMRICTAEGLSDCDALLPQQETCNGTDDDCDGTADEPDFVDGKYIELCDDLNDCTEDSCTGEMGCQHLPLADVECVDGNSCTVADHCEAGSCVGTLVDCDDENPCTADACDEAGGCKFTANSADCDDGDPCTVADQCADGACTGVAVDCQCQADEDCQLLEDGDLCNGTLECDTSKFPYLCQVVSGSEVFCPVSAGQDAPCLEAVCAPDSGECGFAPLPGAIACDDGDACTVNDMCGEGQCLGGAGANCNDGLPCTLDLCDPESGCFHENAQGDCDDGNPCTTGDSCLDGVCQAELLVDCDDGNACTKDQCLMDGQCANSPVAGACSDGDPCTVNDWCDAGQCVSGQTMVCNDGNPCTADSCGVDGNCLFVEADLPCDDGNNCTSGDHCDSGQCVYDSLKDCDDNNVCTTDSCDPAGGCVYSMNEAPCEDEDVCTIGDHCHLGQCISSGALGCEDGNPCTDDSCNPLVGCAFLPNEQPCDDGNECSKADVCSAGVCSPGVPEECDDEDPCTDDYCDFATGCFYTFNEAPCDDGDFCTANETCLTGQCQGGVAVVCADNDVCTDDSCAPAVGCIFTNNTAPCDDGMACLDGDVCADGACAGPDDTDCDDSEPCTVDTCEEPGGCLHTPEPDGTPCGENLDCQAGICQSMCEPGSQTFQYTGAAQAFEIPDCKTTTLEVWGASGGYKATPSYAGKGGFAKGTSTDLGSKTVYVYVGGEGGHNGTTATGGWNGGGAHSGQHGYTNGGGGASDVRVDGQTLNHRIIVGGGGGASAWTYEYSGIGGLGGGLTGGNGGHNGNAPNAWGRGGEQNAGGSGGYFQAWGGTGTFGSGGAAINQNSGSGGAGAGGGGWWGGGGGAHGGGGGGGSSYVGSLADSQTQPGVQSGHGKVVISWTP